MLGAWVESKVGESSPEKLMLELSAEDCVAFSHVESEKEIPFAEAWRQ